MSDHGADMVVEENSAASRYEVFVDGRRAGYAEYELATRPNGDDVMTFTHTVTEPAMRGRGIAAIIVRHALDDARATGRTVVAQCWYVAQFIDRHPAYADLLQSSALS